MSADADTVREALWPAHIHEDALAALARLEAADDAAEALAWAAAEYEAQRDTLAEALRPALLYIEYFVPLTEGEINGFDVSAWCDLARAALAEAGLE